jgi:hypothetical protein
LFCNDPTSLARGQKSDGGARSTIRRRGDELVTTCFPGTPTRGFAAVNETKVAVCLLPGSELAFKNNVGWRRPFFGLFQKSRPRGRLARFLQVNKERAERHHDAIEFPDGKIALLTDLQGQRAAVLQLPVVAQMDRDGGAKSEPSVPAGDMVPTRTLLLDHT